jgi:hypothetical protein
MFQSVKSDITGVFVFLTMNELAWTRIERIADTGCPTKACLGVNIPDWR